MIVRDERDERVISEVIERDTYQLDRVEGEPSVVYDIGAHIGAFATHAHDKFPTARIVCVEPVNANFALLQQNAPFAELHHGALYYGENPTVFHTEWQTGSDIIAPPGNPFVNEIGYFYVPIDQKVNVLSLADIISGDNGLLKLDCEFAEYPILEEIIDKRLGMYFSYVCGEYHLHKGEDTARIRKLLIEAFPHLTVNVREGGFNNVFYSW